MPGHYAVTFSHKRNKKLQGVNLQYKKIFWPEEKRWIRLRVSTKVGLLCAIIIHTSCRFEPGLTGSRLVDSVVGGNINCHWHASSWQSPRHAASNAKQSMRKLDYPVLFGDESSSRETNKSSSLHMMSSWMLTSAMSG